MILSRGSVLLDFDVVSRLFDRIASSLAQLLYVELEQMAYILGGLACVMIEVEHEPLLWIIGMCTESKKSLQNMNWKLL